MAEINIFPIDLQALSKPTCKLITAVSNSIGILYEPTRIRRRAKAKAAARTILAKNRADVQDIEARAAERLHNRELRRQRNIESITHRALATLPQTVSDDPVDEDWIAHFFAQCQDVGNEQMQSVWATILAGEVASPGSFSLRTLNVVKVLRQHDAQLFNQFCTFVWHDDGDHIPILTFKILEPAYSATVIYGILLHLQWLGLIKLHDLSGLFRSIEHGLLHLRYFGHSYVLKFPGDLKKLRVGLAILTDVGQELAPVASPMPDNAYRDRCIADWRETGIKVIERPSPPSPPAQSDPPQAAL